MKRYEIIDVKSKLIKQIIWDNNTNQLMVKFIESPIYVYPDVPKEYFNKWIKSESKGKYFLNVIKKQFPKFIRLDN